MSGAEQTETDGGEEQQEQEREPTFHEKVRGIIEDRGADELIDADPDELDDLGAEARAVALLEEEHDLEVEELDDTQATHDELDRLYNDEGLSLIDIGRLTGKTDATIQRRMEQHGLERRGSRNEISEDVLVEAMQQLAVDINDVDDFDEYQELAQDPGTSGDVKVPTTTAMGDEGPHSAHTYYNYFDSWSDAVEQSGAAAVEPEPEEDEEEPEADEEQESDEE